MVEEAQPNLSPEELRVCEGLKAAVEDIDTLMSEGEVNYKLVDDQLFREKPSKTLVGLTIERASDGWPGNRGEVVQLLKKQIDKGADFARALAIESKKDSRDHIKILLEILFSESILASDQETENDKKLNSEEIAAKALKDKKLNLKEIAAKAANDRRFLSAIDDLHRYYSLKMQGTKSAQEVASKKENIQRSKQSSSEAEVRTKTTRPPDPPLSFRYKTLEIQKGELQLYEIEADPYFRSLKWLLETSCLFKDDTGEPETSQSKSECETETPGCDHKMNVAADDIFLEILQFVSDIRDEIPATYSYLKTEYQHLSNQAEMFAVALIDEVENEEELSTVIKMDDKFSEGVNDDRFTWMREGIEKVSLIQHAINLRCKTFVVSKNCQHLLKEVIFGRQAFYRFWDDPRVETGTGMPPLFILLIKGFRSLLCSAVMTVSSPVYFLISIINLCRKPEKKYCSDFCDFFELPCQKYLLELWLFITFLGLVIYTSDDNNYSRKDMPSGLSWPYIVVAAFVVGFWLRLLTNMPVCLFFRNFCKIPSYRRNWHFLLPDILTVVEVASLSCFTIAYIWWIIRWGQLDGWRQSDNDFQKIDVFYSVALLLCFFKLAHYLKAQHTLGALNLSLYMMITEDVIYFAIIFVLLLYVPFATALKKLYSYYEVDNMNNATHALARYQRNYGDLFWTMMGSDVRKDIEISDSNYAYMKELAEIYIAMFAVAAVVVAFNMLVATMNNTYNNIMQNVDKEYVFSRTRMWIEYIAMDHSALPPPLNWADIIKCFCKCSCKRNESSREEPKEKRSNEKSQEELKKKRKEEHKKNRKDRISIIKRLVFRYLRRSLIPDSTEYLQDVPTQSSASLAHDPGPSQSFHDSMA